MLRRQSGEWGELHDRVPTRSSNTGSRLRSDPRLHISRDPKPLSLYRKSRDQTKRHRNGAFASKSEQDLQRELDLTRVRGGLGNNAGRGIVVLTGERHGVGRCEVRVIENGEALYTELQIHALRDAEPLDHRCVEIP